MQIADITFLFARRARWRYVLMFFVLVLWVVGFFAYRATPPNTDSAHSANSTNSTNSTNSAPNYRANIDAAIKSTKMFTLSIDGASRPTWWGELARVLAGAFSVLTVAFLVFRHLPFDVRFLWRLFGNHVVVAPLNPRSLAMARYHRQLGERVTFLEDDESNPLIESVKREGMIWLPGDPTSPADWGEARIHRASRIIVAGAGDVLHGAIYGAIRDWGQQNQSRFRNSSNLWRAPLPCHVEVVSPDLEAKLSSVADLGTAPTANILPLRSFDPIATTACELLRDQLPLDREGIRVDSDAQPVLVILGLGRMGRAVALEAARRGAFPNRRPLRLVLVDHKITANAGTLRFHHSAFPGPDPAADTPEQRLFRSYCQVEFAEYDVESQELLDRIAEVYREVGRFLTVAVCLNDDAKSIAIGLEIAEWLQKLGAPPNPPHPMIALRMHRAGGVDGLFRDRTTPEPNTGQSNPENARSLLTYFGLHERQSSNDHLAEESGDHSARSIHECYLRGLPTQKPGEPDLGTRKAWAELDLQSKRSNRRQADLFPTRIRSLGMEIAPCPPGESPGHSPTAVAGDSVPSDIIKAHAWQEHSRWCMERLIAGWTLGVRNKARKVHDNLVPWENGLPDEAKNKDIQAINSLKEIIGFQERASPEDPQRWMLKRRSTPAPAIDKYFGNPPPTVVKTRLNPKTVVTTSVGVRVLITRDSGQWLMVQRPAHSRVWPELWELPGGKADPGEDLGTAALREAREETGFEIELVGSAGAFDMEVADRRFSNLCFQARILRGSGQAETGSALRWIGSSEWRTLPIVPAQKAFLESMQGRISGA